ncbi:MAG: hypothetical protein ACO393_04075 [Methylophilaceae bacterium]
MKYIEESNPYEVTARVALEIIQFEDDIQQKILDMMTCLKHPGNGLYDSAVLFLDDDLMLKVSFLGEKKQLNLVYSIEDITDIDVYLDYINQKKAIVWNTHMST